jgi:hypothetical protein
MSSYFWPTIETSKVNSLWFRPLQPGRRSKVLFQFIIDLFFFFSVREELSLAKFEEILEQERRQQIEKGIFFSNF